MNVDFRIVEHFKRSENWGDLDRVDSRLVYSLDEYRDRLGYAVHLSPVSGAVCATDGHSDGSYHYPIMVAGRILRPCQAADVFVACDLSRAWLAALRHPAFMGIGVYPFWLHPDLGLKGGLHLDIRTTQERVLWWRDREKVYHYLRNTPDIKDLFGILLETT